MWISERPYSLQSRNFERSSTDGTFLKYNSSFQYLAQTPYPYRFQSLSRAFSRKHRALSPHPGQHALAHHWHEYLYRCSWQLRNRLRGQVPQMNYIGYINHIINLNLGKSKYGYFTNLNLIKIHWLKAPLGVSCIKCVVGESRCFWWYCNTPPLTSHENKLLFYFPPFQPWHRNPTKSLPFKRRQSGSHWNHRWPDSPHNIHPSTPSPTYHKRNALALAGQNYPLSCAVRKLCRSSGGLFCSKVQRQKT